MSDVYFIGVDVGSASVRAGLFSSTAGKFLKTAVEPIEIYRDTVTLSSVNGSSNVVSQSSSEIWNALCKVVTDVVSGVDANNVKGIGFDATCSLVVIGPNGDGLDVSGSKNTENVVKDVVMWMDHRASVETDFINNTLKDHSALRFVGGQVSLEMELPKILWIKKHLPDLYHKAAMFFDLCDFLTWKTTDESPRSICSVVCKWLYQVDPKHPVQHRWDADLLKKIDLVELTADDFSKIGKEIMYPGTAIKNGISQRAAKELGLSEGTQVAVGMIDAHAGALGLSFCSAEENCQADALKRLSLICGTSTCFMISNSKPVFVPGVWGPYYSAIIPETWTAEGGQSSSGQFLDHVIQTHPYYVTVLHNQQDGKMSAVYKYLNQRVTDVFKDFGLSNWAKLSEPLHIFPDYHGNRSPLSNPNMKGMISGLTLDGSSEESLLKLYVAALQALAYESRWIMETMEQHGITVDDVALCGGLAYNPLFIQTLTDVLGKPVLLPDIQESVLLGSAILAATASGYFKDLQSAARAMAGSSRIMQPTEEISGFHDRRYKVFRKMADFQQEILKSSDS